MFGGIGGSSVAEAIAVALGRGALALEVGLVVATSAGVDAGGGACVEGAADATGGVGDAGADAQAGVTTRNNAGTSFGETGGIPSVLDLRARPSQSTRSAGDDANNGSRMTFRLFGFDVEIQPFFWVMAFLLGMPLLQDEGSKARLVVWVAVVFLSILVHELGHAFAFRRFKVDASIALHGMGGTTYGRVVLPLTRVQNVIISLAGPCAGFLLAGLVYGATRVLPPAAMQSEMVRFTIWQLRWVNVFWGVMNLLPVLPYDGGHVLEAALGPKRQRATMIISMLVGGGVAALSFKLGWFWGVYIFGRGALLSYLQLRSVPEPIRPAAPARPASGIAPEHQAKLISARAALAADDLSRALALAQEILDDRPADEAQRAALEVMAWAHFLGGNVDASFETLSHVRRFGEPDAALVGALLHAKGDLPGARKILEQARAKGDDRKEVAGPLIQVLLAQGEVARAAATALDIADALSEDDARKMAELAFDGGAFDWSARLSQVLFLRLRKADDAYEAARALAKDGQVERALDWLRKAVEAGFHDRARAFSDAALESLRAVAGFDTVLPKEP